MATEVITPALAAFEPAATQKLNAAAVQQADHSALWHKAATDPVFIAEEAGVQAWKALEAGEENVHLKGMAFGHAMIALRDAIKQSRSRDLMETLARLGNPAIWSLHPTGC